MKYLLFIIFLLAGQPIYAHSAMASNAAQRHDDIMETVVRHVLRSAQRQTYFISFMGKDFGKLEDPSNNFMKRFAAYTPHIRIKKGLRPKSLQQETQDQSKNAKTDPLGLILWLTKSHRTQTEVWESAMDNMGVSVECFTVLRKRKRWRVTKVVLYSSY